MVDIPDIVRVKYEVLKKVVDEAPNLPYGTNPIYDLDGVVIEVVDIPDKES